MGMLKVFNSMVRAIFERPIDLLLPTNVQEQQILDALQQTMLDGITRDPDNGRQVAPSRYLVHLNPQDLAHLSHAAPALDERMSIDLKRIATNQGYLVKGALKVSLDDAVKVARGRVVCVALGDDAQAGAPGGAAGPDATHTMEDLGLAAPAAPVYVPPAWLAMLEPSPGHNVPIDRPITHIGRDNANNIVLSEKRVSRFHAEVRYEHGQFMLYDVQSVNGVYLNGAKVTHPVPLSNRDIIEICGYSFIFTRR